MSSLKISLLFFLFKQILNEMIYEYFTKSPLINFYYFVDWCIRQRWHFDVPEPPEIEFWTRKPIENKRKSANCYDSCNTSIWFYDDVTLLLPDLSYDDAWFKLSNVHCNMQFCFPVKSMCVKIVENLPIESIVFLLWKNVCSCF